jgi:hypothetical protein
MEPWQEERWHYVPPDDEDFIVAIVQCPMTLQHEKHYYHGLGFPLHDDTPDYLVRYCRGC